MIERRTICSTPPGCHNGCGIIALLENGRVTEVRGDPSNPFNRGSLCPRGAALPATVYHSERVLHPLRKTSAGWTRIGWEDAMDLVEERFCSARDRHGPESVIFCKGTGRDIGPWLSRLAYGFGSPEYYAFGPGSGSACLMPRMSVTHAVFGGYPAADCSQYFARRYEDPRWRLPECILVWGSNPVDSNPDGFLGQWVVQCMKLGSKLVVVDPRETWMARRADVHLAVNPGTDGALALAFLSVLFDEDLCDRAFTESWVSGAGTVREMAKGFTPEAAEDICGVPAGLIRRAARLYGTSKPAALHWGVAIDMCRSALGTAHALTSLMVLSGNLDVPGGNVVVTDPYGIARRGIDGGTAARMQQRKTGAEEYPMTRSGYPYAHADVLLDGMEAGREIPCAWYQGTGLTANGFAMPRRAARLLERTGFAVMTDLFMTPEADRFADLFLPVCTCLERRGIRNWWYQLAAFDRVIGPRGDTRSDMQVVLEAGRRIAPDYFPWDHVTGWFDHVLEPSGHTWKQLLEKGWLMPGPRYGKHHEEGGFPTPSGKVELQPALMERAGLLPAPWFVPPAEEGDFPGYPLRLTTGARIPVFFGREHRNVPQLREHHPLPLAEVHPDDVPEGVSGGDWILLESPWGSCVRVLSISPSMKRGVVSTDHGWTGPGLNVNDLLDRGMTGRGGLGYPFRALRCRLTGPVPPPDGLATAPGAGSPRVVRRVRTVWCTGCMACAVACRMHTGRRGITVRMEDGELTPCLTAECSGCPSPPCVSVCHTRCLDGLFDE